jgi:DNA-binding response OmpR family regulator
VVSNLRGILRKLDPVADMLQTKRGLGYLLAE